MAEKVFHVTFGINKKVISVKESSLLINIIQDTFDIPQYGNILIQRWDKEWSDWVDVDNAEELESRTKLRAQVVQYTSSEAVELQLQQVFEESSSTKEDNVSLNNSQPSNNVINIPVKCFTPSLTAALSRGGKLEKHHVSYLLNCLYDELSSVTQFPTKDQYKRLAEQLVLEYPALAEGIEFNDAVSLWRRALSDKFRNQRKYLKKRGVIDETPRSKRFGSEKISKNTWGIPLQNYLPDRHAGESEESIDAHIKWMYNEFKKVHPDFATIKFKMELTFPERRRQVVTEGASINDIKSLYPCLFVEEEFLDEFKRLVGRDVVDEFFVSLEKYGPAVIKEARNTNLGKRLFTRSNAESSDIPRQNIGNQVAPLLLTSLAGEEVEHLIKFQQGCTKEELETENDLNHVYISTKGELFDSNKVTVVQNNIKILDCSNLARAVMCLLATYYLFSIPYPKELTTTLKLIQHLFLNIQDTGQKSKKFLRIVNTLSVMAQN